MSRSEGIRKRGLAIVGVIPAGTLVYLSRSALIPMEISEDVKIVMDRRDYNASSIARMVLELPLADKSEPSSMT